jgi:hypothetical protein
MIELIAVCTTHCRGEHYQTNPVILRNKGGTKKETSETACNCRNRLLFGGCIGCRNGAAQCLAGAILNDSEDLTVNGSSCFVTDTLVQGNVTVTNSPTFVMLNCRVFGSITVTEGQNTLITETRVFGGDIVVEETTDSTFLSNNVIGGDANMVI